MRLVSHVRLVTGVLLVTLSIAPLGNAQVLLSPAFDDREEANAEPEKPESTTFRLHPAVEPDPALRYRLWPAVAAQRGDEAIPFISRALLLQYQAIHQDDASAQDFMEKYETFSDASIDELPREELRAFLKRYGELALKELARAENRMGLTYDLGLSELSVSESVSTSLPEFQETRNLARLLQLRIRLAIAEGRWDDAIDDLRLGLRLSEFAGRSTNFVIGRLVGIAISGVMLITVEEAIERPDCPNLYWALATIPAERLFETGEAIEFEVDFLGRFETGIEGLPTTPVGSNSARRRLIQLAKSASGLVGGSENGFRDDQIRLLVGMYTVTLGEPSRDLLAETTSWGEAARELSLPEAALRAAVLKLARVRDKQLKWTLLPQPQWTEHQDKADAAIDESVSVRDPATVLVGLLAPAVRAVREAGARGEQQLHFLITLEAIRMHAASYGELPESLSQLDPIPAWNDPLTTEPFGYQRNSPNTATLTRAPRWSGDDDTEIEIELETQGDIK